MVSGSFLLGQMENEILFKNYTSAIRLLVND